MSWYYHPPTNQYFYVQDGEESQEERRPMRWSQLTWLFLLPLLLLALPALFSPSQSPPQPFSLSSSGPYSVEGPPSLSVAFMTQLLSHYGSPVVGEPGAVQRFYDDSLTSGIDDVYAIAFFQHESSFGTTGEARATLAIGNERCIEDRPCIDQQRGGYAQMQSWSDGIDHWYSLIQNLYIQQLHETTIAQIIPTYAPNSDGNNEAAYIAEVEQAVDSFRHGSM